jgi:hypothetical protein
MNQRWFDPRLIHDATGRKSRYLNAIHHRHNVWMPMISWSGSNHAPDEINAVGLEIYANGTVMLISKYDFVTSFVLCFWGANFALFRHQMARLPCSGDATRFPFDSLACNAQFESCEYDYIHIPCSTII